MTTTSTDSPRRLAVVSSDGHAAARMADYRQYLNSSWHESFDEFLPLYEKVGSRAFDAENLVRFDKDSVERWRVEVLVPGRADGYWDAERRLKEVESEGVVAEVLYPDFGLPFEMYAPFRGAVLGYPPRTPQEVDAGNRAHNRWLVDYCSQAPGRLAGLAVMQFEDVDYAVSEVRWAKEVGMAGVVLPHFTVDEPLFHPKFDPIWAELAELGLPACGHVGSSSVAAAPASLSALANPVLTGFPINPLFAPARQILTHMIWGGVLERHPTLTLVMTEMGSGWTIETLNNLEYTYSESWLSRDVRKVLPLSPKEYFERQVYLGSSLLSLAESQARHEIGVEKMMIGIDYPHFEGAWNGGTQDYLRATLGAAQVPFDEADVMLGKTTADVFGFDYPALSTIAERVGPTGEEILTPPVENKFPRGDVRRPLSAP
jgi:predicted TIM-barrel fold metal-dependent hydrolase